MLVLPGSRAWEQPPPEFRYLHLVPDVRHYQVYVGTTPMARATWMLQPASPGSPDTLVFRWNMEGYLNQDIEVHFLRHPRLAAFRSRFISEKQSAFTEYRERMAIIRIQQHKPVPKATTLQLQVPEGALDLGVLRLAVTLLPLEVGASIRMQAVDVRKGKLIKVRGFVSRVVEVEVPAGTFSCYRVELFAGLAQEIDLVETRPPHRLIRQIYPAVDIDVRLVQQ